MIYLLLQIVSGVSSLSIPSKTLYHYQPFDVRTSCFSQHQHQQRLARMKRGYDFLRPNTFPMNPPFFFSSVTGIAGTTASGATPKNAPATPPDQPCAQALTKVSRLSRASSSPHFSLKNCKTARWRSSSLWAYMAASDGMRASLRTRSLMAVYRPAQKRRSWAPRISVGSTSFPSLSLLSVVTLTTTRGAVDEGTAADPTAFELELLVAAASDPLRSGKSTAAAR